MNKLKVVISGGGTGGHIFPAISIANAIKERYPSSDILFIGAKGRMEMTKVPAAGYEIIGLNISGFNRRNIWKNIKVLWKLHISTQKAKKILKTFSPDLVIGVGGYASGPALRTAHKLKIPTLIQEQNSYAGITNKYLAKKASAICVAYEGMEAFFPKDKIILTGNPCRSELLSPHLTKEEANTYFGLDPAKKTILVVGGSLGAKSINNGVLNYLKELERNDIQVIWQCGESSIHEISVAISHRNDTEHIHLYDFISRMDLAYHAADLVVSRAGAGAISELSLLGKPTILVPSPNVAEDHQTKNAQALVDKNAAMLMVDSEAARTLIPAAIELVKDDEKLKSLSMNISKLAQHDSANRIVDEAMKIINKHATKHN